MSSQSSKAGANFVRPLYSCDKDEAKRRVLGLYKAWYRQIPWICRRYEMPKNEQDVRNKIREEFLKNKDVTDIRQIDRLVALGNTDLKETVEVWKQKSHQMAYFHDTIEPVPKDFMGKFFRGMP